MLELRVEDIRLRGRGFTLFAAAKENGVDERIMDFLISTIYAKLGLWSGDFEREEAIRKENPNIIDTLTVEDVRSSAFYVEGIEQVLVSNGIVSQNGADLVLTAKTVKILTRAAEIQNELDEKGFQHCPCHM